MATWWRGRLRREDHDGIAYGGGEVEEAVDCLRDEVTTSCAWAGLPAIVDWAVGGYDATCFGKIYRLSLFLTFGWPTTLKLQHCNKISSGFFFRFVLQHSSRIIYYNTAQKDHHR